MPLNLEGIGAVCLRSADALRVIRLAEISISTEEESQSSNAYPSGDVGKLGAVDTFSSTSTDTITLGIESFDDSDLDLVFGVKSAAIASITIPVYKIVTVPVNSPYTVTEADLTVNQEVEATLLGSAAPGNKFMSQQTTAPDAALEYQVTANTITFNSTEAGRSVAIYYRKSGAALTDARGGTLSATDTALGQIELFFRYKFTRSVKRQRWYPQIQKAGGATFEPGGDNISLDFTAQIPAGFNFTYLDWPVGA